MKNKLLVYILGGGVSAEHEVSLKTANTFYRHIDRSKYDPVAITISKQGVWELETVQLRSRSYAELSSLRISQNGVKDWLKHNKPDVVLLGLHGTGYEDGQIQALFDRIGTKYTGSGASASRNAFHKALARQLFDKAGLSVAKAIVINKKYWTGPGLLKNATPRLSYPFFAKPVQNGSSFGISRAETPYELEKAFQNALKYDDSVLIEEEVKGRELSCGVIQDGDVPIVLPPTEIISPDKFFSYQAKYGLKSEGGAEEITPAPLTAEQTEQVQAVATVAHEALNCRGITRTDMILTPSGELFVLEINTLPGMTETSLVPQQAKVAGLNLKQIIDLLIEDAIS